MTDLFSTNPLPFLSTHVYPYTTPAYGRGYEIDIPEGKIIYIPKFIDQKIADHTLSVFFANTEHSWQKTNWHEIADIRAINWQNIEWQQDSITIFGKKQALPRVSAWYGDSGKSYKYSGILLHPKPWTPALSWFKTQLSHVCEQEFNSVLLNWYRSGQDYISWHADAEPELGKNPTIASLNFGETRRFLLRHKADHQNKIEIPLGHGDLLIMQGALQHYWQHSVPKQTKISQGRLNMTFRHILT